MALIEQAEQALDKAEMNYFSPMFSIYNVKQNQLTTTPNHTVMDKGQVSCYLEPCVCSLSELKESSSCLISISSEEPVYSGRNPITPSSSSAPRLSLDWVEVEGPAVEVWNSREFTRPFSKGLERIFSMALKYGQSGVSPLSLAVDLSRLWS